MVILEVVACGAYIYNLKFSNCITVTNSSNAPSPRQFESGFFALTRSLISYMFGGETGLDWMDLLRGGPASSKRMGKLFLVTPKLSYLRVESS